jgi:hypothetical protein
MKRSLLVLSVTLLAANPAKADLTHKIQSSVQLSVDAAVSRAIRQSNSYSVSGSGVATSVTSGGTTTSNAIGGFGAATNGVNAITLPSATQATSGNAFTFSQTYYEGDAVPTQAEFCRAEQNQRPRCWKLLPATRIALATNTLQQA